MRFSIVFDDNGAILDASVDGGEKDKPMLGTDDLHDVELNHTVERMLINLDARMLKQSPDPGEADDSEFP